MPEIELGIAECRELTSWTRGVAVLVEGPNGNRFSSDERTALERTGAMEQSQQRAVSPSSSLNRNEDSEELIARERELISTTFYS